MAKPEREVAQRPLSPNPELLGAEAWNLLNDGRGVEPDDMLSYQMKQVMNFQLQSLYVALATPELQAERDAGKAVAAQHQAATRQKTEELQTLSEQRRGHSRSKERSKEQQAASA